MRDVRKGRRLGDFTVEDPIQFRNPITGKALTLVTGVRALDHGVDRQEQDEWALRSHQNYFKALDSGMLADELAPLTYGKPGREALLAYDEPPRRDVDYARLASLQTVGGSPTITAGNAPGLNDGASALLLASSQAVARSGAAPLAQILSYAQVSGGLEDSVFMPGVAIRRAVALAGVGLSDLARIEINEAFAAMPLVSTLYLADGDRAVANRLREICNVNGGAVAIGHPPGASGARILLALTYELRRRGGGIGVASICGGYGQADAIVVRV